MLATDLATFLLKNDTPSTSTAESPEPPEGDMAEFHATVHATVGGVAADVLAHPDSSAQPSTTQRVANQLRQLIIQGELPPGQKLKVDSLKSMLGTGASPIREALSLLTSDLLVERLDQRGFRVAPASVGHFKEILMLRCELEGLALTASLKAGDAGWEESLVLAHYRLTRAAREDAHARESFHRAFHLALINACGSPILLRFCEQLYDLNIRYRNLAGRSVRYEERDIHREHQEILDAAVERDITGAVASLEAHYRVTGEFLSEQFSDRPAV